jgi:hypothetical protein
MFNFKKKSSAPDQDSQSPAELASQVNEPTPQQYTDSSNASIHSTDSSKSKFSLRSKKKDMSITAASASPMPEGVTDPNYAPPPGYLGNLTVPQLHCLEKLKKELKEEGIFDEKRHDDATLLRWVCGP